MFKKTFFLISALAISIIPQASFALDNTNFPPDLPTTTLKTTLQKDRQELKAEMQTKRQTFRNQINTIKDERKKLIAERIDDRVATSNARLTNKMSIALTRISNILAKIKTKRDTLKASGKDTTALDAAIAAAQDSIAKAQAAVDIQETKAYSATIGDDATLKNIIGQMISGFRLDIQGVHKLVVDAKQAVVKALSELAKLRGDGNVASGSAIFKE